MKKYYTNSMTKYYTHTLKRRQIIFVFKWLPVVGILLFGCTRPRDSDRSAQDGDFIRPSKPAPHSPSPWQRVLEVRPFVFPDDHGPHEQYQLEWWYYTGNLRDESGSRYGYQLTFFRTGMRYLPDNPSRWALRDLYIAHFALTDVLKQKHRFWERMQRTGPGWAGVTPNAERIWNGNWQLRMEHDPHSGCTRHFLSAQADEIAVDLVLTPVKPLVLHGDRGLSRKGAAPGNASYYYSFTRLATHGELQIGQRRLRVSGESWMDHEFSSSFLEDSQAGWDWFSIQLDNGCELMLYQMRRNSGEPDAASSGTIVYADGSTRSLLSEDFHLEAHRPWTSPRTGGRYPLVWRISIPAVSAELEVTAVVESQEMDTRWSTGMAYWEGCIDVKGLWQNEQVTGHGYLEMTGRTSERTRSKLVTTVSSCPEPPTASLPSDNSTGSIIVAPIVDAKVSLRKETTGFDVFGPPFGRGALRQSFTLLRSE